MNITQITQDGQEIIGIPVILHIAVDPLDGFTAEEAIQVAKDRLAEQPLQVTLGGVPIPVTAEVPLLEE
jgi:hypothetical protein